MSKKFCWENKTETKLRTKISTQLERSQTASSVLTTNTIHSSWK